MAVSNGFTRMPALASTELDHQAITLLTEWINQALPQQQSYAAWRLMHFASASSPEGEPDADPDGDLRTNYAEWLADTSPDDELQFLQPSITVSQSTVSLQLTGPADFDRQFFRYLLRGQ